MTDLNLEQYLTPHKLGRPVLTGSGVDGAFDDLAVDCPFVFEHAGAFYMLFVGFDGKGYQTGLARSTDLVEWEKRGVILGRGEGNDWDNQNAAGTWLLCENDLDKPRTLRKWQGKYWLVYHSYPGEGYEVGPGRVGLAWTEDESLMSWHRLPEPILLPEEGAPWEQGGLYKECLILHDDVFYLFYNAKNRADRWIEQIGVATSRDLVSWARHADNPVLPVTESAWDAGFSSDPGVVHYDGRWAMYYFGYDFRHAQEGIAFSDDLIHWVKHPEPIITVGNEGELDSIHAHKPSVIKHDGVLYHFYCACRSAMPGDPTVNLGQEFRCLTVATSEPLRTETALSTPRQRFLDVLNFRQPADRLPMVEWAAWWDQTIVRWEQEGLPARMDLETSLGYFGLDPMLMIGAGPRDTGCPGPQEHGGAIINDMAEYEAISRYLYTDAIIDRAIEFAENLKAQHDRGEIIIRLWLDGFFWFPRVLLGIEPHFYAFYDKPELMHRINSDLADFNIRVIEALFPVLTPDMVGFAEDMSYNHGPMLSKKLFATFLMPYYQRVIPHIKRYGVPVLIDSDGDITKMIPWMYEAGIEGVYPLERQAGVDIVKIRELYPDFLMMGGYDKMVMSQGEAAMRAEFERLLPVMRSGGYIPSVDHQTPPGVSLENYRIYVSLFEEYCRRAAQ